LVILRQTTQPPLTADTEQAHCTRHYSYIWTNKMAAVRLPETLKVNLSAQCHTNWGKYALVASRLALLKLHYLLKRTTKATCMSITQLATLLST